MQRAASRQLVTSEVSAFKYVLKHMMAIQDICLKSQEWCQKYSRLGARYQKNAVAYTAGHRR